MNPLRQAVRDYASTVARLAAADTTNEGTYYPAIRGLLASLLDRQQLPFEVRTVTSEQRAGGGTDQPDLAFYDGPGDFVTVLGEAKLPTADLHHMAASTERGDQVGRYLAQTRIMLLCNVRAFGLLTADPRFDGSGPVPPEMRRLEEVVELWPSALALKRGSIPSDDRVGALAELVEVAVTRYATIGQPESLARILARQARRAKAALPDRFSDAVQGLLDDFGKALGIHFETEEGEEFFASSLIQTAFYGLFAGWALWWHSRSDEDFRWEDLSEYLKIPFVGELFHEFRHPTRIRELGLAEHLDRATETLRRVDTELFFARFHLPHVHPDAAEAGSPATTAIMYFYEPFLEAFDPELRKRLGVWYTPVEVIRYQVRKIDRILREELDCPRGFAEDRVVVLDPCCGTGAYLIEVLRCVAEQLESEGIGDVLGAKLRHAFTRRIIGFEILTAPFVVAQLQLYLILSELGAAPDHRHRPAIFLTNALTGWEGPEQLELRFPELQAEHDAARKVKRDGRIIVVLGNPPYDRWAGVPIDEEAELVDHYKGIQRNNRGRQVGPSELYRRWGIKKQLLNELYVRFFRLAEKCIGESAEFGVVSFISNYSFHAGRSHPLMRESLLKHFDKIWIDSLNGDKYRTGKVIPKGWPGAGQSDQSVFTTEYDPRGIQVGTAVTTMLKLASRESEERKGVVFYRDFWGLSADKRNALLASLTIEEWAARECSASRERPEGPREYQRFEPSAARRWKFVPYESQGGYDEWPALDELFPTALQGVNHNRGIEGGVIEMESDILVQRFQEYFSVMSFREFSERHPVLCTPRAGYSPAALREALKAIASFERDRIKPYMLFPLDLRWIYYETRAKLLNRHRPELAQNLAGNTFLVAVPQPRRASESRPIVASCLFDLHLHDRGSVAFPAFVQSDANEQLLSDSRDGRLQYPEEDGEARFADSAADNLPRANLSAVAWSRLRGEWNLAGDLTGSDAMELVEALFGLALAVCYSPQYEREHRETLAQDWAHLPIPKSPELFRHMAQLGRSVRTLLDPLADPTDTIRGTLGRHATRLGVIRNSARRGIVDDDLVVTFSYFGSAAGRWVRREPAPDEGLRECWGDSTGDLFLNPEVYLANVPEAVWRYELGGYPVIKKWLGYRDAQRRSNRPLSLSEAEHLASIVRRLAALLALAEDLDAAYEQSAANAFTADELTTLVDQR